MWKSFRSEFSIVDDTAKVSEGVQIWHFSQLRERSQIGFGTIIGKSCYVGPDVTIGSNCKIQNSAQIFEPAVIGDAVFIGPSAVLTNDQYPRATNPDLTRKKVSDWKLVGVVVETGASVGAGAICVAPIVIGAWSVIGAGSVVISDVKPFALVVGNPAKQIGWVGKSGHRLISTGDSQFTCPISSLRYTELNGILREEEIK
jgi:acetyltransferase-like isoleucine patch superfamily enzyme